MTNPKTRPSATSAEILELVFDDPDCPNAMKSRPRGSGAGAKDGDKATAEIVEPTQPRDGSVDSSDMDFWDNVPV